ncbi:MAG: L-2-hydroxyglutarate oxidase [Planctomycetota bacterium]
MPHLDTADLLVIGGGIVGLSVAYRFQQAGHGDRVVVLEKETDVAQHQTGRNSGVLHSGVYYKPGSLKAKLCRAGLKQMEAFCTEHGVAWERCGKLIVARDNAEAPQLDTVLERGLANGVAVERWSMEQAKEREPHLAGVACLHVADTGIVDYAGVCHALRKCIQQAGGAVVTGFEADRIAQEGETIRVTASHGDTRLGKRLVNCAGLQVDRVAKKAGAKPPAKIVPFRGEYFTLKPSARALVKHLIYPPPDPKFPFLGVHFTRMIEQDEHGHAVECGPNAVLAFKREGYRKMDVSLRDLAETLAYPGFWAVAGKYWKTGAAEMWRSLSKAAFVRQLQRLIPEISADDLEPAPSGVRAQAMGPTGGLLDDFAFAPAPGSNPAPGSAAIGSNGSGDSQAPAGAGVHVVNAPSPAATAALAIADSVLAQVTAGTCDAN